MSDRLILGGAVVIAVVLAAALWLLWPMVTRPPIDSGTVLDKDHRAAYTSTMMVPQYTTICSGNPVSCRQQLSYFLPITTPHPERWTLFIDPPGERGPEWITVPKTTHDSVTIGARWDRP